MALVRIQKLLSDAGVASRRAIEQMILDGRITVNGDLVAALPCFVDPEKDDIVVDSQAVPKRPARKTYILINKPRSFVCTENDPQGRPRVFDLVAQNRQRLFCVAQLDPESSGLVLLTNDGELTKLMTNPRAGVLKKYVVEVDGRLEEQAINTLKDGMYLDGRRTRGAFVKILSRSPQRSMMEIDLVESTNREVRRVLARLGHKVRRMKRVALGPLTDRGLKIGRCRDLLPHEIKAMTTEAAKGPTFIAQPPSDRRERPKSFGRARKRGSESSTKTPAKTFVRTSRTRDYQATRKARVIKPSKRQK